MQSTVARPFSILLPRASVRLLPKFSSLIGRVTVPVRVRCGRQLGAIRPVTDVPAGSTEYGSQVKKRLQLYSVGERVVRKNVYYGYAFFDV